MMSVMTIDSFEPTELDISAQLVDERTVCLDIMAFLAAAFIFLQDITPKN
tara:strand:- start:777 stop:926 length:150 start_codon:yes stop_codon:yes gene_type:complete